ncbi:MAG: aminotransferase class V-fold PLP-dependent enzyme [Euzebya sp.]
MPHLGMNDLRAEFDHEVCYLNTATYGLPPRRSWQVLQQAQAEWRAGTADAVGYDTPVGIARASYARLVGVEPATVAIGSQASACAGIVAASLPDDAQVLVATGDFTSILFPFHAQAHRGVTVREVPLDDLVQAVEEEVSLVSVSAVQSSDGRVVDLAALHAACQEHRTQILLDLTQAAGWLPVDASLFDYTVCSGYKWLLAPRGTAFLTVRPDRQDGLVPHAAGWYAGDNPWTSIYGGPLRLARDARRFDVSPAWLSWVAAAPAVTMLADVGAEALQRHSVGLANDFRIAVGLAPGNSAIVSLAVSEGTTQALAGAQVIAAIRDGRLRLSFHVSTDAGDVDRAVDVLAQRILA